MNEAARLAALHRYRILDTPPEANFDRLSRRAAHLCRAPIALVSLIDADRQWFKAKTGLEVCETPRSIAFCAHAIQADAVFVVPDALMDARFADNPLVTGDPFIRFYAGAPLITSDGFRLGTLCVIDTAPREGLTDEERAGLEDLAALAVDAIEKRLDQATLTWELQRKEEKAAVLRLAAKGASLADLLIRMIAAIERLKPGVFGSVMLLDPVSGKLKVAAGPSLPPLFRDAIATVPVGAQIGSCGAAAHLRERVVVEDIRTHPNWEHFKDAAAAAGLAACWSQPILDATGQVLGTFAFYFTEPRAPEAYEIELLDAWTDLAGLLIDRQRTEIARIQSEARLKAVFDNASVAIFLMDDRQHCVYMNRAAEKLTGYTLDEVLSLDRPLHDIVHHTHPDGRPFPLETCAIDRAFPANNQEQGEEIFVHRDGHFYPVAFTASPIRDETANVVGTIIEVRDIRAEKAAQEQQLLLMREVDHRAKNALAVVQAVVKLTKADSVDAFVDAVQGRVVALARAHELLARSRWTGADLGELVQEELAPYIGGAPGRHELAGPPVTIGADAVQAVGMVIHELATNAAKYGALSSPTGSVQVRWEFAPDGTLDIVWRERGGPAVAVPTRKGFGSQLILTTAAGQLGGAAGFEWEPTGLVCRIRVAPDRIIAPARGETSVETAVGSDGPQPANLNGRRILLAEDDALLALDTQSTLEALGCQIVGPAATLEDVIRLAATEALDGAVLDINLRGHSVMAATEVLKARGVPYLFATGYAEKAAPGHGGPVLQKPFAPDQLARVLKGLFTAEEAA